MNHNNHISEVVFELAEKTFEKLKKLNIPPYPKYYHDAFWKYLTKMEIWNFSELSKKHNYLFSNSQHEEMASKTCFGLAGCLEELVKSNDTLKSISDENALNIDSIKKDYSKNRY